MNAFLNSRYGVCRRVALVGILLTFIPQQCRADEGIDFFENRIRPVLVERCYECHNSHDRAENGLVVDHRAAIRKGGDSGASVVPGKPADSLLLKAIQHAAGAPRMPQDNPKLSKEIVADFAQWIQLGAPDPRDKAPSKEELAKDTSWETTRDRRKQWWSFQPIKKHPVPQQNDKHVTTDVDRFVLASLRNAKLTPAKPADRRTLIRRVTFALIGLPPTQAEIEAFVSDKSKDAWQKVVDRLIESEHFGERWARHWMDWFRYAETHGSEGDVRIPHAYRYRDYLIRSLNSDIPYNQMVKEHIAGDLLPQPRIDPQTQLNESAMAIGHFRMVEHGFAPIDALDEKVRWTDNQIDVVTKAFLGLTVSCARCHNHKFDAISQKDFYALFGVFGSSRPATIVVDSQQRQDINKREIKAAKLTIRRSLADEWLTELKQWKTGLSAADPNGAKHKTVFDAARKTGATGPLREWVQLAGLDGDAFAAKLKSLSQETANAKQRIAERADGYVRRWDLDKGDHAWNLSGNGLGGSSPAGSFALHPSGDTVVASINPGGIYSNLISDKHRGMLTSPDFNIDFNDLWVQVAGASGARARFVVENYPRAIGLLYKSQNPNSIEPRWMKFDMSYFKGDLMHLELVTARDIPVEARPNERSWFGVTQVVCTKKGEPAPEQTPISLAAFTNKTPKSIGELRELYRQTLVECVTAWRDKTISNEQSLFLSYFVRNGMLPNSTQTLPNSSAAINEYRRLEAQVPVPVRAAGLVEAAGTESPLFIRGNHLKQGEKVPRRFLEAFDSQPIKSVGSGRLMLAEEFASPRHPMLARVIVNRVWHHLFGNGLVRTTDNFGRLGEKPSHPELLDHLAAEFIADGYSIKRLIRRLTISSTFQRGIVRSKSAIATDPENRLLSSMSVRRLEAEAIRDSVLEVSGVLNRQTLGPSVGGGTPRRSLYVIVNRNSLDPFLSAFDWPAPFTTKGRRDVTNVPAQSLALMNDPFVVNHARIFAQRVLRDQAVTTDEARVARFFELGLGRPASQAEVAGAIRFMNTASERQKKARSVMARIQNQTTKARRQITELLDPIRESILAKQKTDKAKKPDISAPIARWEFENDLKDSIGNLHGEAVDNAHVNNGGLVLDGRSYVRTALFEKDLSEKTLEVWLTLSNITQRAGGAITVQTPEGLYFDSIVYAEREARRWMPGSNGFSRTQNVGGTDETDEATKNSLHVAITYAADGTVTVYRNGEPYGRPYKTSKPPKFAKGKAQVIFGMRHGTPTSRTAQLSGVIHKAQLYDRALTPDEVAASGKGQAFVSQKQVLAQLSEQQRRQYDEKQKLLAELTEQSKEYSFAAKAIDSNQKWYDLGLAIFNFKEFIYVK
jgi:hypothetical protein